MSRPDGEDLAAGACLLTAVVVIVAACMAFSGGCDAGINDLFQSGPDDGKTYNSGERS